MNKTRIIKITLKQKAESTIFIGSDVLRSVGLIADIQARTHIAVITDSNIPKNIVGRVLAALKGKAILITLRPGEKAKTMNSVIKILNHLHAHGFDRNGLVINLGGGVVSDVGGFAASIYMRGLDTMNVPTTLLAQADAALGGKTGINSRGIKNLIGTIHQPIHVLVDVSLLRTLRKKELTGGLAEIIKHGLIADEKLFHMAVQKHPDNLNTKELTDMITRSCLIKARVVSGDQDEKDGRKILNFGHTIAHAVEALSFGTNIPLGHGEAVLLGMIAETIISSRVANLPRESQKMIIDKLRLFIPKKHIRLVDEDTLLEKIQSDKKKSGGVVKWTLIEKIGQGIINQVVPDDIVIHAIREMKGILI